MHAHVEKLLIWWSTMEQESGLVGDTLLDTCFSNLVGDVLNNLHLSTP